MLEPDLLDLLLKSLGPVLEQSRESTIEVNPESLTGEKCDLFLNRGLNRISIGMQSLYDEKLFFLGRIHSADQALKALDLAVKSGFQNISADFIYALPKEKPENWEKELKDISGLPVQHLSCYALSCESNTEFYKYKNKIDQGLAAEMYGLTMKILPQNGFSHYEISNYARKDLECLHNMIYWENRSYLGLGPAAFSYIQAIRSKNISDTEEYMKKAEQGGSVTEFEEKLKPEARARETAAMNIRRSKGIVFQEFRLDTGFDLKDLLKTEDLDRFLDQGLLRYNTSSGRNTGISLTEKGFLFADEVCSALV